MKSTSGSTPPPAPTPASAQADTPPRAATVMALVNGRPVYMAELVDLLVRAHGQPMAEQLVANEVVRQEAAQRRLTVTDREVLQEHQEELRQMFPAIADADERERGLAQLLLQKAVSRRQWDMTMWRNAALRKMAAQQAAVSEEELRQEYAEEHGRRAVVRHIQTASLEDAQAALKELAGGADFADLARRKSTNVSARQGGLLPPIGAKAPQCPPVLRDAALRMKAPAEIAGPVQVGTTFHLLRLERIIEPDGTPFADVKAALAASVAERKVRLLRQRLLAELMQAAKIQYMDPALAGGQDALPGGGPAPEPAGNSPAKGPPG